MAEQLSSKAQRTALDRVKQLEIQKKNSTDRSKHQKVDFQEKLIIGGASFGFGMLRSKYIAERKTLPTVLGIDAKLLYTGVAFLGTQYTKGMTKNILGGVTDALIGAYFYELGREKGNKGGVVATRLAEESEAWVADQVAANRTVEDILHEVQQRVTQDTTTAAPTGAAPAGAAPAGAAHRAP